VLRLLPAPELLEVEEPHGIPDALWWRGRRLPLQRVEGPERMSGDWWRADPYARDYWRAIADPDGALLFYRTTTGAWYLQGWYD
jgi:protein ImuB